MKKALLRVNDFEWDDDPSRRELACRGCEKPTTGRHNKRPYCLDCAIRQALDPMRGALQSLRQMFGEKR